MYCARGFTGIRSNVNNLISFALHPVGGKTCPLVGWFRWCSMRGSWNAGYNIQTRVAFELLRFALDLPPISEENVFVPSVQDTEITFTTVPNRTLKLFCTHTFT